MNSERWLRRYIHVQLTLFVYLERFRRYSTFFIWLGFPNGGESLGHLKTKHPDNYKQDLTCKSKHFFAWNFVFFAPLHPRTSWRYLNDFTYLLTYLCLGLLVNCLGLGLERHCLSLGLEPQCLTVLLPSLVIDSIYICLLTQSII